MSKDQDFETDKIFWDEIVVLWIINKYAREYIQLKIMHPDLYLCAQFLYINTNSSSLTFDAAV